MTQKDIYAFIDNSFLFIQGYKHVKNSIGGAIPDNKTLRVDYFQLKNLISEAGNIRRLVLVGSNLSGTLISSCQKFGYDVFTLPRYPDIKTGKAKEKGVDQKIGWEIAKTIFTNKEPTINKKIILCSGDKDFIAILSDIYTINWEFELWLWKGSYSQAFASQVKVFGTLKILDNEWKRFIKIVDKKRTT